MGAKKKTLSAKDYWGGKGEDWEKEYEKSCGCGNVKKKAVKRRK